MLRSIVVPLDGTPHSEEALPFATRIACATGARLHLVRVVTSRTEPLIRVAYPCTPTGLPPTETANGRSPADDLDRIATEVASRLPASVGATLLQGDVTPNLRRFAREVRADGVILATPTPSPCGRFPLGRVADDLLGAVGCPILAIPSGVVPVASPPLSAMLVALDGCPSSECILSPLIRLALALSARITLLHVLPAECPDTGLPICASEHWDQTMRDGEAYLDRIRERLRRRGLWVDTVVMAHPSLGRAICEVADEVDAGLVAVGTHGRDRTLEAILGSATPDDPRQALRPLLVQRARGRGVQYPHSRKSENP